MVYGLSHEALLNCFLSSLNLDIRKELVCSTSMSQVIGQAKLIEFKLKDFKPKPFRPYTAPNA